MGPVHGVSYFSPQGPRGITQPAPLLPSLSVMPPYHCINAAASDQQSRDEQSADITNSRELPLFSPVLKGYHQLLKHNKLSNIQTQASPPIIEMIEIRWSKTLSELCCSRRLFFQGVCLFNKFCFVKPPKSARKHFCSFFPIMSNEGSGIHRTYAWTSTSAYSRSSAEGSEHIMSLSIRLTNTCLRLWVRLDDQQAHWNPDSGQHFRCVCFFTLSQHFGFCENKSVFGLKSNAYSHIEIKHLIFQPLILSAHKFIIH